MADLRIGQAILFTKDLTKLTSFYRDVLGLKATASRHDPAEFVVLEAGACQLCLHRIPDDSARNIAIDDPPHPRSQTPIKLVFVVEDVDASRASLLSRGATMGPVHRFPPLAYCDGTDPEGNIFQVSNGA